MKNKVFSHFLNAVWYFVVFLLIQFLVMLVVGALWYVGQDVEPLAAMQNVFNGQLAGDGMAMVVVSALSSVLTILVFVLCRWSPFSRRYLKTQPWGVLAWVVLLACGTIIPSEWLLEQMNVEMNEAAQHVFEQIMKEPWGYLALGMLAPVAEEVVFRGAILRSLLRAFDRRWHWLPIVLSALVFGAAHGNSAQFFHATLVGLLLGWMYYRTDSIVPGLVLHWVNNSVAYVLYNLLPQTSDETLLELCNGNQRLVYYALGCSLCIMLPSLFQLAMRLPRRQ